MVPDACGYSSVHGTASVERGIYSAALRKHPCRRFRLKHRCSSIAAPTSVLSRSHTADKLILGFKEMDS